MTEEPRPPRGRPSARDKILDATLALVVEIGPETLTLDAVAARAGVSKGGLLYHFPFKEDLFLAANEHLVRRRVAAREIEYRNLPETPSRALKSYVLASVHNRMGSDAISTRMMGAGSSSKETSEPIRRYFRERFPPFAQDVGFERAALVHAATEGLWFMDVMGLSPFSSEQRARLVDTILSIADGKPLESATLQQAAVEPESTKAAPPVKKRAAARKKST